MPGPPDRAHEESRKVPPGHFDPNYRITVRGGSVCANPGEVHVASGSGKATVCSPQTGNDPRPRYQTPGEVHGPSRHSVAWAQRRGTKKDPRHLDR